MELTDLLKIIKEYFPEKAVDLSETLGLLQDTLDDTRNEIKKLIIEFYDQGRHEKIEPHNRLGAALLDYIGRIQEIQSALEPDEKVHDSRLEVENQEISDYSEYIVDSQVIHNLHEDFTYKRPAAFELNGQKIEVKTWQQMLCKTCEMLLQKDTELFAHLEHDPAMRGRKQKLFSTNTTDMRNPCKLQDSELYVETNLSANAIRNLIIKILGRFGVRNADYKVYLRADYSGRHE